jgi:hypothetical protein
MEIVLYFFLPILLAAVSIPMILGGILLIDAIDRGLGGRLTKAVLRVFRLVENKHD